MTLAQRASEPRAKSTSAGVEVNVQYGCGTCAPDGWVNFDASPRLLLERLPIVRSLLRATNGTLFPSNVRWGDIVKGLPLSDGSVSAIYCSHVLEHLPRDDVSSALRNTFRLLVPGGIFRLVVPDLLWRTEEYLTAAEQGIATAADDFMTACLLGRRSKLKGIQGSMRAFFGNSSHLWMYDFAGLKGLLEEGGFSSVRKCEFGDASNPMFKHVEDVGRFIDHEKRELAIEAVRPGYYCTSAGTTQDLAR